MPTYGALLSDSVPVSAAVTEIMDSVGMHNEQSRNFRDLLCGPPTKMEVVNLRERSVDFQLLGLDTDVPDTQHIKRVEIALAAPQRYGGEMAISKAAIDLGLSSSEVFAMRDELFAADNRLVNKLVLGPCFATDGFYNGALASAPPPYKLNTFDTRHTHYFADSVSGVPTLEHWVQAKHTITEHGFEGGLLSFINNDAVEEIEGLAEWASPTGDMASPLMQQLQVAGYTPSFMASGVPVVAEDWVPAGYLFVVSTARKPLAWRTPRGAGTDALMLLEDSTCPNVQYEARLTGVRWGAATVVEMGAGSVTYLNGESYVAPTSYAV